MKYYLHSYTFALVNLKSVTTFTVPNFRENNSEIFKYQKSLTLTFAVTPVTKGRYQVPYGKDKESRKTSASFFSVDFRTLKDPWPGMSLQPTQTSHNFNTKCLHPTHADTSGNSSVYAIYGIVGCKQLSAGKVILYTPGLDHFQSCARQGSPSQAPFHFKSVYHAF